jgi:hypothetical protein
MKTRNLLKRMFNKQTGELEVVTVRTPFGTYEHVAREGGEIKSARAKIEEMKRKNIECYEALLERLDDNSLFIDSVISYTLNYIHGNESGIYSRLKKVGQNKSTASDTGAW